MDAKECMMGAKEGPEHVGKREAVMEVYFYEVIPNRIYHTAYAFIALH